jgi:hypothetical protein
LQLDEYSCFAPGNGSGRSGLDDGPAGGGKVQLILEAESDVKPMSGFKPGLLLRVIGCGLSPVKEVGVVPKTWMVLSSTVF